jgi:ribonucleotide reductase beta subunit family protein with ferritin-like domain
MELLLEPDIYSPSIDETGKYIDKLPMLIKRGIQCPCGARKEKVYDSKQKFKEHIKTKSHQLWLEDINVNRSNHLIEASQLKETVKNQQIIIAQLTRQLDLKSKECEVLKQTKGFEPALDLLTFD